MIDHPAWRRGLAAVSQYLSAVYVAKKKDIGAALLWCAVVAVILLPGLSQVGYAIYSLEYIIVSCTSVVLGIFFFLTSHLKYVRSALLSFLVIFVVTLYFGKAIVLSLPVQILTVTTVSAFMILSFANFPVALRVSGLAAGAQIVAMALVQPSSIILVSEKNVPRKDIPSVIHILVDGHAGMAAFPRGAVTEADVRRLEKTYVSNGFTVFRRAYSADKFTQLSLTRLFNSSFDDKLLEPGTERASHQLVRARILEQISKERAPDLTFSNFVDLRPSLRNIPNVARLQMFRAFGGVSSPGFRSMPIADRMWSAAALLKSWFIRTIESPAVLLFFKYTDTGQYWDKLLKPAAWTNPLLARSILHDLTERLKCCGRRGSYIFVHVISPHHPFVFDRNCHVLPSRKWVNALNDHPGESDTLKTRALRWRRHYDQAVCLASDIKKLINAISKSKELSDATIIIHGDHGARVGIKNYEGAMPRGYSAAIKEIDTRGSFLAVHIPGVMEGGVVDTPVRLDKVYRALAKEHFKSLDLKSLKPGPDSPYIEWLQKETGAHGAR